MITTHKVDVLLSGCGEQVVRVTDTAVTEFQPFVSNKEGWECYLFGGSTAIKWVPHEGNVPDAWVRFWMGVFFKSVWVRNK
jgi:hypothetical protein